VARKADREQILKDAWIGDAVLTLYVRSKILREEGKTDGAKANRMTSNQFLSVHAEPSATEAEIGRIFERDGLEAAYRWIEAHLLPVFEKQEANRLKRKA
jgi:dsRNA-specific ribonuclease